MKLISRERLQNPGRAARIKFPPRMYQRLFDDQEGQCGCDCGSPLLVPARKNQIDHRDPNRQDFNHRSNLSLLLPQHNMSKNADSIQTQSKKSGRGFVEILQSGQPKK